MDPPLHPLPARISAAFTQLGASLREALRPARERLRRATPRERLLLGVLVVGGALYAPIAAMEDRAIQADRYLDALSDRANARLTARAARRVVEGAADRTALADMNSWGFEASNPAIAQVLIEQRLGEAATEAGLANTRITTRAEVEAIGPTQWLGAEVQADLRWDPAFAFLDALAEWPEGFRVTAFRYEITPFRGHLGPGEVAPQNGRLRIGLAFPVRITAPVA